jgi:hypothetical protein
MPGRKIDPLGRQTVLAIAAGRIGIGVGALLATRPAMKALGFAEDDSQVRALGRMAGGRDMALGLLALAVRNDGRSLQRVALAGIAVDATDAIVFGSLAASDPDSRRAGISGATAGAAATIVGAWAWRRIRQS